MGLDGLSMSEDIKITTELLIKGAAIFALMDLVFVSLLAWRLKQEKFLRLKWPLVIAAAVIWYGIWSWAIGNFWEPVYSYVFPAWAQVWLPFLAGLIAGILAIGMWVLAARLRWNPVLSFCLLSGLLGSLTHIWAVSRGIVTKPPMLQGASPLAAVIIAFFEYIFYWCAILVLAIVIDAMRTRLHKGIEG